MPSSSSVASYILVLIFAHASIYQVNDASAQDLPFVFDVGLQSRLQDNFEVGTNYHHLKRGRANICADFNNDGLVDLYSGNPGNESFVIINQGINRTGVSLNTSSIWSTLMDFPRFNAMDPLLEQELAWGGAAADYDEDGDIDLFVSCGGNEGIGLDHLFRNMFIESGKLSFDDVTVFAGIQGPVVKGQKSPSPTASANAVWVDYDRDGDLDLWVNMNDKSFHHNILWQNQLRESGEARFINVTEATGLASNELARTLHSSWSDFDHDGDMDLFQNNFRSTNTYWKNQLVESGKAAFVDNTMDASLPGDDLGYPINSFGSAAIDFNNDGFDDIFCAYRLRTPPGPEPLSSPYGNGNAVFINDGTGKFSNQVNDFVKSTWPLVGGVMGFMVGDLNGDRFPEIYLGNGGPDIKQSNTLLISDGNTDANGFPDFFDGTVAIDFPPPFYEAAPLGYYPPYPYRTHGITFVDTNQDGQLEILANNGGMMISSDDVEEPNRHLVLDWGGGNSFVARLKGNGISVNRDGIGSRLKLTVSTGSGPTSHIYRTIRAGTAFSAQNDIRAIHFALGDSDTIHELEITWTDGTVQTFSNLSVNKRKTFEYGS